MIKQFAALMRRASGLHALAAPYFAATGITDAGIKAAINQLLVDLDGFGLLSKYFSIWPMAGGTAATHAVNLKSPGTYDITFVNSPTQSANGVIGDGSTQHAATGVVPNTLFTSTSGHMSLYVRNNVNAGQPYDMHAANDVFGNTGSTGIITRYNNDAAYPDYGTTSYSLGISVYDARGLTTTTRDGSATTCYKNGSSIKSGNDYTALAAYELFLFALNGAGTAVYRSNKQFAWAATASSFDATDAANEYTAVQAYQTAMGRQV